ncbi:MAG: hypothetical protein JKX76_09230 [Colwellia sp.]|nr:hypothetical protein [Colwellia sp.]
MINFAVTVTKKHGKVSHKELEVIHVAGFLDADILEVIANTVINIFTTYINKFFETTINLPLADDLSNNVT